MQPASLLAVSANASPRRLMSDNIAVSILSCCTTTLANLSRAAAKSASARLRGLRPQLVAPDWSRRATICESCHMRSVVHGVSYCGRPFLQKVNRDLATDGCGCPTLEKAKSPREHCPIDRHFRPARTDDRGACNCKWCTMPGR